MHNSCIELIYIIAFAEAVCVEGYLLWDRDMGVYFCTGVVEAFEIYCEDLWRGFYVEFFCCAGLCAFLAFVGVGFR